MFPTGFVRHLRESAEQLLKDLSHRVVVYFVWVQLDLGKIFAESEQSVVIVQSLNKTPEIEVFDDVAHILTESTDVVFKVEVDIVRVLRQSREVVFGGVIETGILSPSE